MVASGATSRTTSKAALTPSISLRRCLLRFFHGLQRAYSGSSLMKVCIAAWWTFALKDALVASVEKHEKNFQKSCYPSAMVACSTKRNGGRYVESRLSDTDAEPTTAEPLATGCAAHCCLPVARWVGKGDEHCRNQMSFTFLLV